jgi:hypothetical protein
MTHRDVRILIGGIQQKFCISLVDFFGFFLNIVESEISQLHGIHIGNMCAKNVHKNLKSSVANWTNMSLG